MRAYTAPLFSHRIVPLYLYALYLRGGTCLWVINKPLSVVLIWTTFCSVNCYWLLPPLRNILVQIPAKSVPTFRCQVCSLPKVTICSSVFASLLSVLYRMLRKIKEARITHSWGLSDVNVKIHWYFYYDYKVKLLRRINESRSTYSWE